MSATRRGRTVALPLGRLIKARYVQFWNLSGAGSTAIILMDQKRLFLSVSLRTFTLFRSLMGGYSKCRILMVPTHRRMQNSTKTFRIFNEFNCCCINNMLSMTNR